MKKIGILGGTFDPIHIGHINMANVALNTFDLDEVMFIPNKIPYYKATPSVTDNDRLSMIQLSLADENSKFTINTCELENKEYTYTYHNLCNLRQLYPNDALLFIIGMDSFLYLHKWFNGSKLFQLAHIVVICRPQYQFNFNKNTDFEKELIDIYTKYYNNSNIIDKTFGSLYFINKDPIDISSSSLRALLSQKSESAQKFLSPKVYNYIKDKKLYQKDNTCKP
ncbi:MAG: nicotinate-nucleotide adenylyltransferase [Succinivibrionaceae bacterium]